MEIELRQLTLGEILDRTFQLYRRHFLLFTGIATAAATLRLFWGAAVVLLTRSLAGSHHLIALRIIAGSASMVSMLVTFIAAGFTFAALTYAISRIYLGQPTGIADAYRGVRAHLLRYLGLNLAAVTIAWLPLLLLLFTLGMAIAMASRVTTTNAARTLSTAYGFAGLGFLLVTPLCAWLASRYSLANAASILESLPIRASLKRSVALSYGTRGRILLALACIAITQMFVAVLVVLPLVRVLTRTAAHPPLWLTAYNLGWGFIVDTLFLPIYGIVLTLFYYDARIRKEGFDVEWLLERSLDPVLDPVLDPALPATGLAAHSETGALLG
jgi:hypothetical protein